MSDRPVNIELFPCSGGMAEGFRRAGIVFDFAFDRDSNACASYEANLGHRPIQIDVSDLLRMVRAGWRPAARIRLLVADPPCTPWSRAGKRLGLDDERDCLRKTAELIARLLPDAYLIGNVPGLQDSTSWGVVQEVIGGLARFGYCVADYASFDCADYGVPQHRVRPFWFGHRVGTPCIRWPVPTHSSPGVPALPGMGLLPWVTVRDALQHLPVEELGRPARLKRHDPKHPPCAPDEPGTTVRCGGNGNAAPHVVIAQSRIVGKWKNGNHLPSRPDEPALTVTAAGQSSASAVLSFDELPRKKRPPSTKGPQWSRINSPDVPSPTVLTDVDRATSSAVKLEWPWDRPATVVHADPRLAPPGHHDKSFLSDNRGHGPNAIVLSERAASILQGFPDGWRFIGDTKKARWSQIGQAMPPPMAEAVGHAVRDALEAGDGIATRETG